MQDFTNYNPNQQQASLSRAVSSEAVFFQRVYTWMFAGLGLTAVIAYVTYALVWGGVQGSSLSAPEIKRILFGMMIGAAILQLGVVFYLSSRINSLSAPTAKGLFLFYAALTGLTFSIILIGYAPKAIIAAFVSTAGVYGAMAVYGLVTKRSLQAFGSFLFMGLIGLILAMVVNLFIGSSTMNMAICAIGVLIFAGLTAYDHQKLRVIYATGLDGNEITESRAVIMGALNLYLDFINLFLFLLRLIGNRN